MSGGCDTHQTTGACGCPDWKPHTTALSGMPVLIGVTGFARVGKDSTGDVFEKLGYNRTAFADKLRDLALELNPIVAIRKGHPMYYRTLVETLGYEEAKDRFPGVRHFLKALGNGVRTHVAPDAWIQAALLDVPKHTVITDVRFRNEAMAIRGAAIALGGKALILRIDRPGYGPESDFEREVSEIPVDDTVVNSRTLDDLKDELLFRVAVGLD